MIPSIQAREQISRWAGTLDDIARAVSLAIETIRQWEGEPECEIEVVTARRVERVAAVDALVSRIDTRDLTLVKSIRARIGEDASSLAIVHLERNYNGPAVTIEVTGRDDAEVDGLLAGLARILQRGRQRPGTTILTGSYIVIGSGFVVLGLLATEWLGLRTPSPEGFRLTGLGTLVLLGILAIGGTILLGMFWLHPALEVLPPGGLARRRRYAGRIGALTIGAVGLALTLYFGLRGR